MTELDPRAEAFVREAGSAEEAAALSLAQREAIRGRFAARRSAGGLRMRARAMMRAVATVGGSLGVGVPAWAAAAVGVALVIGGAVAATVGPKEELPSHERATPALRAPPPASPQPDDETPPDQDTQPEAPPRSALPFVPGTPPATSSSARVAPSPPVARPVPTTVVSEADGGITAPPAASLPPASDLGGEAALLESAERAIRDHDEARALDRLDEYARRFPEGALLVEAKGARAIALCGSGHRERGGEVAAEIAGRWPNAPILPRVLAACRVPRADP
jgi:hypothetical protein